MNIAPDTHEFAIYYDRLSLLAKQNSIILTDDEIVHRIAHVLRLQINDSLMLFDQYIHVQVVINQIVKKKSISCTIIKKETNKILAPSITFLLPLLKRDALETALYSLAEIGANEIQLVITDKSQKKWTDKDHERAHKIIIAAAEQSKNFAFPIVAKPIALTSYVASAADKDVKIMLDMDAKPLCSLLQQDKVLTNKQLYLIIGPEGGLTAQEKTFLQKSHFITASLTPTVLRACQAAAVSAALVRSCLR